MLLEFKVGNYRSFKDIVTFSMIAAPITEHEESHIFSTGKYQLVKSAVLYGANASGKSNLLKALKFMHDFVLSSSKDSQTTEQIAIDRFRLSTETENEPSFFEITFICNEKQYRYGFEVNEHEVCAEWLFFVPSRQEAQLFTRDRNTFSIGRYFKEAKGLPEKTRPNALFLSVVAQFNGEIATQVLQWFASYGVLLDLTTWDVNYTLRQLNNPAYRESVVKFLQLADVGIRDIALEKHKRLTDIPGFPREFPLGLKATVQPVIDSLQQAIASSKVEFVSASTFHTKYDADHQSVAVEQFELNRYESLGTQRFLYLLGPLFATLHTGPLIVVDELDTRLHPLLTQCIVQLFHHPHTNPRNVQLIFATHDTNLLSKDLFRRDQIWFAEKNAYGATDIYSLVEYKPQGKQVRKDASFGKDYILGRYGAIPFIGSIDDLLTS